MHQYGSLNSYLFHQPARPYYFAYDVKDDYTYNNYGQKESSDGKVTTGSYHVLLPDGRTQIVTYKADSYGYNADVKYEGYAKYPEYVAKKEYKKEYNGPAYNKAASYEAPAYKGSAYPTPSYPTPGYKGSAYPAPSYPTPAYKGSAYPAPSYPTPAYKGSAYPTPNYAAPAAKYPEYKKPEYKVPEYNAPAYKTEYSAAAAN